MKGNFDVWWILSKDQTYILKRDIRSLLSTSIHQTQKLPFKIVFIFSYYHTNKLSIFSFTLAHSHISSYSPHHSCLAFFFIIFYISDAYTYRQARVYKYYSYNHNIIATTVAITVNNSILIEFSQQKGSWRKKGDGRAE